jgi:prolyl-tRNA editing enzyme YbaK/EbsC (Cys-tRNA(Pro) deacylase)
MVPLGAPEALMNNVLTVHRMLLENGLQHEIVQLPQTITSADQLPAALALPPQRCLAVRVYQVDDRYVAIIVPADTVPPAQLVREITGGQQARGADEAEISSVTGYTAGLVAPLALPDEMPLYVDQALADSADDGVVVYTATGESGTALGIRLLDLLAGCAAKPAALSERQ